VPDDLSRLRQRLRSGHDLRGQLLRLLMQEGPGLIRGTFRTRRRVCGRPGCHCSRGELHASKCLAVTVAGRSRQVHVPAADEVRVAAGVHRYGRFRATQTQIAECDAELRTLLDALAVALLAPYPPDNPIPAPRKRGRKPKKAGGRKR
jgi:hypothetical protein